MYPGMVIVLLLVMLLIDADETIARIAHIVLELSHDAIPLMLCM